MITTMQLAPGFLEYLERKGEAVGWGQWWPHHPFPIRYDGFDGPYHQPQFRCRRCGEIRLTRTSILRDVVADLWELPCVCTLPQPGTN